MSEDATLVGGIVIPSTDPVFIAMTVGVHIPLGIACVLAGAGAMLSEKRRGRQSKFGTVGALSFASAWIGRSAIRLRWRYWARLHITGLGLSYVLMLIAFYVDNGKQLPVWKDLPHAMYWLLPSLIAAPLLIRALLHHPVVRASRGL